MEWSTLPLSPSIIRWYIISADGHELSGRARAHAYNNIRKRIIESVDSISRDERDAPLMQYIKNAGITRGRYIHYHAF